MIDLEAIKEVLEQAIKGGRCSIDMSFEIISSLVSIERRLSELTKDFEAAVSPRANAPTTRRTIRRRRRRFVDWSDGEIRRDIENAASLQPTITIKEVSLKHGIGYGTVEKAVASLKKGE